MSEAPAFDCPRCRKAVWQQGFCGKSPLHEDRTDDFDPWHCGVCELTVVRYSNE